MAGISMRAYASLQPESRRSIPARHGSCHCIGVVIGAWCGILGGLYGRAEDWSIWAPLRAPVERGQVRSLNEQTALSVTGARFASRGRVYLGRDGATASGYQAGQLARAAGGS